MEIISVKEKEFKEYGKVIEGLDVAQLLQKMQKTPLPDDVIYEPSDASLEALDVCEVLRRSVYGGLPVQIGYCNGHNEKLNGLEYHRSSEINIAVTDMILLLGKQQDIESDDTYDTAKVKAFFVPAGTVIEVFATTLHYAPCGVDKKGFRCVVVLPKGTNYPIEQPHLLKEDKLLAASNKWLLAHEEAKIAGAFNGLKGENISIGNL